MIARGDGSPVYNFAVAVDDLGHGHHRRRPRRRSPLERAEAAPRDRRRSAIEPPRYAHLPLLHGPDGKKLSKRHGAASVQELRDAGYLPAAVRNYLALLGWGTDDDTTLLSTDELVERFRIEHVGKASAIFDEQKLRWINGRFMREMPLDEYTRRRRPPSRPRAGRATTRGVRDRPGEGADARGSLAAGPLPLRGARRRRRRLGEGDVARGRARCSRPRSRRSATVEPFDADAIEAALRELVEREGVKPKQVFQPLRVAITGGTVSPGIFESLATLGRDESVRRIERALGRLAAPA